MPARFSGRTNNKNNSGSGMAENPAHLVVQARLRPVGMLLAQTRRFHFTRRPVEPLGQPQPPRTGHGAQRGNLFGTGLLIRQHGLNMSQRPGRASSEQRLRRVLNDRRCEFFNHQDAKAQSSDTACTKLSPARATDNSPRFQSWVGPSKNSSPSPRSLRKRMGERAGVRWRN